jgi:tRNA A37 threonylcarbamoyltransferase TsaD
MQKYYTRACNFYHNKISLENVKKGISLPVGGNNSISFDTIEIITRTKKKKINIKNINKIYVNLGPGRFSSLRISLSIAKAISLANNCNLIGFKSKDLLNKNYRNLIKSDKKKISNKGLIKPMYSS